MPNRSDALNDVFRALADPTRRAVVTQLAQGPASVKDLSAPFEMALPSFMQHLRVLEDCGLMTSDKKGRVRICSIRPGELGAAEAWLAGCRANWEARLDRLDAYLGELQGKGGD